VIGILSGDVGNIVNILSAASGVGTAAMGLVDATKAFWGGPSNLGFGYIRDAARPFLVRGADAASVIGANEVMRTLKANWLNGMPKAEQKARAKALVHLFLVSADTAKVAQAAGIDPALMKSLVDKTRKGVALTPEELSGLGQFDAVVSAALDAGYERGDQKYRDSCKTLAFVVSLALATVGGALVSPAGATYIPSETFFMALLVGLLATPLAPVAKDVVTSLQAAAAALQRAKR
jgi:hypothetical protein